MVKIERTGLGQMAYGAEALGMPRTHIEEYRCKQFFLADVVVSNTY